MSSFNSPNPNFDSLLLQTLMGRLQIRPPPPHPHPFLDNPPVLSPDSIEQLLLNNMLAETDSDEENDEDASPSSPKSQLAKEESRLEKEIIRTVLSGKTDALKPNSGQAVMIGEHHICVAFHEDTESDYRVWEWHGHIMLFDEEDGYSPEYIYGNYFERITGKKAIMKNKIEDAEIGDDDNDNDVGKREKKEDKAASLGLRELIESGNSVHGRILHRNVNAGSTRF